MDLTKDPTIRAVLARDLTKDVITRLESAKKAIGATPVLDGQELAALFLSQATTKLNEAIILLVGANEQFS